MKKHLIMLISLLFLISCGYANNTLSDQQMLVSYAAAGNVKNVSKLLNEGVDPNIQDSNGKTALIQVAELSCGTLEGLVGNVVAGTTNAVLNNGEETPADRFKVMQILLDNKKTDVDATDNNNATALMYAAQQGCIKEVNLLLDKGANVKAKDNKGLTALMYASIGINKANDLAKIAAEVVGVSGNDKGANSEVIEKLLQEGAEINAKDDQGKTALKHAEENDQTGHARLLRKKGAKR